ncbi:MAG: glycogen debranching enzyme, partial [Gammaproteobacteria bacterium]
MKTSHAFSAGTPGPPGATFTPESTNFAVYCRAARSMELLLYADDSADEPFQVITLALPVHRDAFFWHVAVHELPIGTQYTWRVTLALPAGEQRAEVLDPFARAISTSRWQRAAWTPGGPLGLRGIVVPVQDEPRPVPFGLEDAVIYELHVRGFTRHPSSGVRAPGTFSGLIEKIPYLLDLGVTHVQLLPIAAFDEQDVPPSVADLGLHNFWGYSPLALASLHPGYG